MDKQKFDALTRAFAMGTSRRTAIKGIFGGAVGVAVASTHLSRAGAQGTSCTPETVLEDCVLPDECTIATCEQGVGTEAFFCAYSSDCDANCCPGGYCAECCDASDCEGSCDICDSGLCVSTCNDCQECEGGICADLDDGVCCGGTWIPGGQCCSTGDCLDTAATFCSSVTCSNYLCTVVPECPADQECCGYGQEGAYCAECCNDDDCLGCADCVQGFCSDPECCYDTDCPECYVCGENGTCQALLCLLGETCCGGYECIPEEDCCKGPGDWCGVLASDSDQLDCCDGLVCCENWNSQGSVCAQCCNDWDCGKGGWCDEGWCKYPDYCDHDKDCPKGTCCCKDGSCSGKCCDHHPHHPHYPKPEPKPAPPASGGTVSSLPATGAGPNDERNNLLGVAALGAAAAVVAARKMRETSGETTPQE